MNQTWENSKKARKPQFVPILCPLGPNSSHYFFFIFRNMASSVTRYHGQLALCTILEKTDDSILRKFSDPQMDGQKDRQVRVIL